MHPTTDPTRRGHGPLTVAAGPAPAPQGACADVSGAGTGDGEITDWPGADEPEVLGGKKGPLRRCVASSAVASRDQMVRFVIAPDGILVPDVEESLPGRGLWLTADPAMFEKAVARNLFAKAARRAVRVEKDLAPRTVALLRRRCLALIGLACRGGGAVAGFEKVQAALRSGRFGKSAVPGLWLEAADGAADGRAKLAPLAAAAGVPLVAVLDRRELGLALGREEAVHAVLARGPLTAQVLREFGRLSALAGLPPVSVAPARAAPAGSPDGRTGAAGEAGLRDTSLPDADTSTPDRIEGSTTRRSDTE
ncbi:RNA-binding protein [Rhodocista pekingensis]|uniref:RNA-binding protein n=1 Tax=Rhodocista pekingensis TaxID=201185 RepID=A0ABW2L0B4_9PROT